MMSLAEVTTYKHQLKDGRQLSYAVLGLPINSHGAPRATCIYTHGWPSSRLEAIPLHNAALNLQYRILSLDRPGIGGSTFDPAGSFESWARDVQQLLDAQGVQKAVFIGMSGGGPFACACARFLPERTAALVTMSSMVATNDPEAAGLKAQMHWMNRFHCGVIGNALALRASVLATWPLMMIAPFAASALRSVLPASVARLLLQLATAAGYSEADRRLLVDNPDATLQLLWVMQQAVVQGVAGLEHDMALTSNTWSFRLEDIRAPVVLVFQGEGDVNVPKAMGEHLAAVIPGAQAIMLPGEGHMSPLMNHPATIMTRLDEALHGKQ